MRARTIVREPRDHELRIPFPQMIIVQTIFFHVVSHVCACNMSCHIKIPRESNVKATWSHHCLEPTPEILLLHLARSHSVITTAINEKHARIASSYCPKILAQRIKRTFARLHGPCSLPMRRTAPIPDAVEGDYQVGNTRNE